MGEQTADRDADEPADGLDASASDREVTGAIARGDHKQALRLCARYHGRALGRLCMSMLGSTADADDLVQETLLDAHAGFAGFRENHSPRAWLFGIARRKCARHLERNTRRRQKLLLVHDVQKGESEDLVLVRERARQARRALAEVRPSEREAVLMRYVGDLSYREMGEACGIEEASARQRVSRAIAKLRSVVKAREQEP